MNLFKIKTTTWVPLIAALAIAAGAVHASQPSCISFESPLAGGVFSSPVCTVSLNVNCANLLKVDLQARYFPEGSDSAVIVSLGTISRPPFKLIWNMQNLPNQLFTGIGILAEATISGSAPQIARQEGIFLTHHKAGRQLFPMPYSPGAGAGGEAHSRGFSLDGQKSAGSVITWNERELTFNVNVKDPSFYSNQPGRNIAEAGLEILIDPARRRAPHPADSTLFFVVPLSGAPYRINYRTDITNGAFKLTPQSERVNYAHNVGIGEFKGYSIRISIPKEAFGKAIPDTIGCNLVLRTLDERGQVQKIPLSGNGAYEIYSPYVWSDYYKLPKPFLMNAALQWVIFPAAGFLLAFLVYLLVCKLRKPHLLSNFERSEEDKSAFGRVNNIIEQELVRKDLKIEYVADKCKMDLQTLNGLIKRNTGFTFASYLQFCRTEVAKERLRSSHSSEKSIADLCGFASAMEMEKCFLKFHRTTPYKFRTQQQVT